MNAFRLWLLRKLLDSITQQAIDADNHLLADNVLAIADSIDEIERILGR